MNALQAFDQLINSAETPFTHTLVDKANFIVGFNCALQGIIKVKSDKEWFMNGWACGIIDIEESNQDKAEAVETAEERFKKNNPGAKFSSYTDKVCHGGIDEDPHNKNRALLMDVINLKLGNLSYEELEKLSYDISMR